MHVAPVMVEKINESIHAWTAQHSMQNRTYSRMQNRSNLMPKIGYTSDRSQQRMLRLHRDKHLVEKQEDRGRGGGGSRFFPRIELHTLQIL